MGCGKPDDSAVKFHNLLYGISAGIRISHLSEDFFRRPDFMGRDPSFGREELFASRSVSRFCLPV
jgi:hypothetical protein